MGRFGDSPQCGDPQREQHRFKKEPEESNIVPSVTGDDLAHYQCVNDTQLDEERAPDRWSIYSHNANLNLGLGGSAKANAPAPFVAEPGLKVLHIDRLSVESLPCQKSKNAEFTRLNSNSVKQ